MASKRFTWIGAETETSDGKRLETGKTYDVSAFGDEIVAEWVRTKNARISGKSGREEIEE